MAKRRKKKRTSFSASSLIAWIDPMLAKRVAHIFVWIAGLGGLSAACVFYVPRLEAYAAQHNASESIQIVFNDPPAWFRGDLEAMLVLTARQHFTGNPLAQDDLVAARKSLLASAWFDDIKQVQRIKDDLVRITADFVKPYAVVRDSAGDHLIDPRGKLLPRSYPNDAAPQFTVITGAYFDRPGRPGLQWEGADITAALRVMRLIESKPWNDQVRAIDLNGYFGKHSIVLVTDRDSRIIFGRPPGEEGATEVSAQRKLAYLDYHYENHSHIDRGFDGEIDIRGDVVTGK